MKDWQIAVDYDKPFPEEKRREIGALRANRQLYYPVSQEDANSEVTIMPTRFGNIIRSFEKYPRQAYGADSVYIWPRMASVVSKDFIAVHDDARSQVDCFVNITHLAIFIAIISLVSAGLDVISLRGWNTLAIGNIANFLGHAGIRHLMFAGGGLAVAIFAYWRACVNAIAWGHTVRSAFDCFLPALIKQLGFAIPPKASERKQFWREFSRLVAHGTPMRTDWPIADVTKPDEGGAKKSETGAGDEKPPPGEESGREPTLEASEPVTVDEIRARIAAK